MTAIAGFWSFEGTAAEQSIERMLNAQAIYGKRITHASSGGLQIGRTLFPTVPEDRFDTHIRRDRSGCLMAADVRLDNRPELQRDLGLSASEAGTLSDSALLQECLVRWGESVLTRLAGEFAFAYWDPARQRLLLARDVSGARPLFFHRGKDWFAFSSMPSGLHSLPHVPYDFDADFMAAKLALLPHRDDSSWFRDIKRVIPGHCAHVSQSKIEQKGYWTFPSRQRLRTDDIVDGLRSTFDEAVHSQLRGANGLVGSHLSSGLDSGTVTATAARQFSPGKVLAFTGVPREDFDGGAPGGAISNEAPGASEVAALYDNVEHFAIEADPSPLGGLETDFHFQQFPAENLCNAAWGRAIMRAANQENVKVFLIGFAGNLTISYAGMEHLPQLLRAGRVIRLAHLSYSLVRNGVSPLTIGAQTFSPFLPEALWRIAIRPRRRPTRLHEYSAVNAATASVLEQKARDLQSDFADRARSDPDEMRQWTLTRSDGGNYFKGILAEWGLSLRDPTLDQRVLKFCLSMPHEEFIKDGVPRSLARRAFGDRLPQRTVTSLVRGYQAADWYERLGSDLARARSEISFVERCPEAAAILDVNWLRGAVDTWPTSDWTRSDVEMRYRHGLLRGISAGYFMRKVKGTN